MLGLCHSILMLSHLVSRTRVEAIVIYNAEYHQWLLKCQPEVALTYISQCSYVHPGTESILDSFSDVPALEHVYNLQTTIPVHSSDTML